MANFGKRAKKGGLPQEVEPGAPPVIDDLRKIQEIQGRAPGAFQAARALGQNLQFPPPLGEKGDYKVCFRMILSLEDEAAVADELSQS